MNLAEYSIKNSVVTWVVTIALTVVGAVSFTKLARLEDPEFTIKDAVILTPYAGASATEVEEEVTNVIEKAVQELGQLKFVESRSSRGLSYVKVKMKDKYDKSSLPSPARVTPTRTCTRPPSSCSVSCCRCRTSSASRSSPICRR